MKKDYDFSESLESVVNEITKYNNDNLLDLNYSENELSEIIHKAFEQNEMAIYLIYEIYKSILKRNYKNSNNKSLFI